MRATAHERRLVTSSAATTSVPKRHLRWSVANAANPAPSTTTRVPPASGPPCGTSAYTHQRLFVRRNVAVDVVPCAFSVTCTSSS